MSEYLPMILGAAGSGGGALWGFLTIVVVIVAMVVAVLFIRYGWLWIQALSSGCHVGLFNLVAMQFRKVSPGVIVNNLIKARKAAASIETDFLESHWLAGGNVPVLTNAIVMATQAGLKIPHNAMASHVLAGGNVISVVTALIAATRGEIALTFDKCCAIDLAGRDVLEAVRDTVKPKVIDCPTQSGDRGTIDAVAMDGIQLKAKARVTVRMRLEQLIGGATEETIIARVGEGIVSAIGSARSHKEVLQNPDRISKAVLAKGLDSQTAFEIVSIDIADVDVGANIGAKLQTDQAEADKRIAQAKAEERAAMARAREQEMRAQVVENRAKVVLAEAEIPKAMADSFRSGNLGIMDYYRMKNIQADTSMRDSIAGEGGKKEQSQ